MSAPVWEDLNAFLSTDDFADLATFIPSAGTPRDPVPVIFDDSHCNAEAGEVDVVAGESSMFCKASDAAGIRKDDVCVVSKKLPNGTLQEIGRFLLDHDPYPDGTGMVVVKLSRDFD
jgi:hypothetical protein